MISIFQNKSFVGFECLPKVNIDTLEFAAFFATIKCCFQ